MPLVCPLCANDHARLLLETEKGLRYYLCSTCDLRFLDPRNRLSASAERAHYLKHENDVADPRYRAFLRPLAEAIVSRLPVGSTGLDYGAGPAPVLAEILTSARYPTAIFDPYFFPEPGPLGGTYDFVVCTEVAEHFFSPGEEFRRLKSLLAPGGWLGLMTLLYDSKIDFEAWYYRWDPTHVAFYSRQTFEWLTSAMRFSSLEILGERMVLLRLPR